MTVDRWVLAFAGTMVLTGLALGYFVHPGWFWVSVFVGANMLQSAFTGFCPFAILLKKLGVAPGAAFG